MSTNLFTSTIAVVVAAGGGKRAGGELPKQYQNFMGRPLLAYTLANLAASPQIDHISVVISTEHDALYAKCYESLPTAVQTKLLPHVYGGATRQASVYNGLLDIPQASHVLIHDAARPFANSALVSDILAALASGAVGAVPTLPVVDTLKHVCENEICDTQPRAGLCTAQTPQGFVYAAVLQAHELAAAKSFEGTDDASLLEHFKIGPIANVAGQAQNIKITHMQDWNVAHMIHAQLHGAPVPDIRTASGFDIHRYTHGARVTLGGSKIPHTHGVDAHSDGDVVLHALTDAILGLCAGGDIGQLFPNTDAQWHHADSAIFVHEAMRRLHVAGGRITHVDVSVMCEAPKIGGYRSAIIENIAALTGLSATRIGLKATTMEKLGAIGRGEGLAAQVLATAVFMNEGGA